MDPSPLPDPRAPRALPFALRPRGANPVPGVRRADPSWTRTRPKPAPHDPHPRPEDDSVD